MKKEIVNSRLLSHLSRFYPDTCTIRTYTLENQDTVGQPDPTWADFAGHIGIPCAVAGAGGREVKGPSMVLATSTHTVGLAGCYPNITAKMRAIVNSVTYDILLAEVDSHAKMTRLTCQIVT